MSITRDMEVTFRLGGVPARRTVTSDRSLVSPAVVDEVRLTPDMWGQPTWRLISIHGWLPVDGGEFSRTFPNHYFEPEVGRLLPVDGDAELYDHEGSVQAVAEHGWIPVLTIDYDRVGLTRNDPWSTHIMINEAFRHGAQEVRIHGAYMTIIGGAFNRTTFEERMEWAIRTIFDNPVVGWSDD